MNIGFITICFVCALSLSLISLNAEEPNVSASYKKTFEKFLAVSQSDMMMKELYNGLAIEKQILTQAIATKSITKTQKENITRIVHETLADLKKQLENQILLLYNKHFTEQDLHDLIALYQTPAGRKLADNAVAIFKDSQELAQTLVIPHLQKMAKQISQIVSETKK